MTSTPTAALDVTSAVLCALSGDRITLGVPGTSYQLDFRLAGPAGDLITRLGKRVRCRIEGKALRMHVAAAGGRFIEPVYGHPRIVQGTVAAIDAKANRVLVDLCVPVWFAVADGQTASEFTVGQMVNMYVESGMTCTIV